MEQTEPMLTVEDISTIVRLSVKSVQRLCRIGRLPAVKVANKWRVKQDDFRRFVDGTKEIGTR